MVLARYFTMSPRHSPLLECQLEKKAVSSGQLIYYSKIAQMLGSSLGGITVREGVHTSISDRIVIVG